MVSEKRELVGFSRTITADDMLAGYRRGLFPMSYWGLMYQWWSPDPRGVLPLGNLRIARSLRKSIRKYRTSFDTDFAAVVAACSDPDRPGGWIDPGLEKAYLDLHERGLAHSVETRNASGTLVGGLFGVNIGGFFAGESMFHTAVDASKVALVSLVDRLGAAGSPILVDTQWRTEHLASLGVVEIRRSEYLQLLAAALARPNVL